MSPRFSQKAMAIQRSTTIHERWDFFNHEEHKFSRMGSGLAGDFSLAAVSVLIREMRGSNVQRFDIRGREGFSRAWHRIRRPFVAVGGRGILHKRRRPPGIVDGQERGVAIHPNAPLQQKPWGMLEFALLDPDMNLLTFGQETTS